MAIPTAVEEQAQRANDLISQLANTGSEEPAREEEGQAEPELQEEGAQDEESGEPEEPEGAEEPGQGAEGEAEESHERDWKQAYNVLKGKYDAEVPRMAEELRSLRSELDKVKRQKEEAEQNSEIQGIDPEDFGEYGEEFQALAKSQKDLLEANKKLREELNQIKDSVGSVEETQRTTVQNSFYSRLNELCPEWGRLNKDQGCLDWLQTVNPYTGDLRINSMQSAEQRGDAATVAAIFNEYRQLSGFGKEPEKKPEKKPKPKNLQPSSTHSGNDNPAGSGKRTWSRAQIKQFYQDKAMGSYEGRDEEARQLEQDIFKAQSEGRVIDK